MKAYLTHYCLPAIALATIHLALANYCKAYFEPSDAQKRERTMNDISFENYKDFPKKWRLVTVRFREDSAEQRFTYANELAWEAMKSLKPNYPDGAIFGKVGFITEADPSFPSSKVPSGARRFQLMIKDRKKYKDTDGWGYALFDSDGFLFNEDMKAKTLACAACHRLVPERDFVFSRPISLVSGTSSLPIPISDAFHKIVKFRTIYPEDLDKTMARNYFPKKTKVRSLEGDLQKNAFSGTLDEIVPLLIQESAQSGIPSILFINKNNFSAILPLLEDKKCTGRENYYQIHVVFNSKKVRDAKICH